MPGVRIRHVSLRGVTVTVLHHRPYRTPVLCSLCKVAHEHKTYHITLDGEGTAIVSPRVLARLKEVGLPGFTVENEVPAPPPMTLSMNGHALKFNVVEHTIKRETTNG